MPGTTKPRLAGFITSMTSATVSTTISRQCAAPSGASSGALTTTSASRRRVRRAELARQQAVAGDDDAGDDQRHAPQHAGVHRHVGEAKAHVAAHPVHRQVQDHAGGDGDAAGDEGAEMAAIGEAGERGPCDRSAGSERSSPCGGGVERRQRVDDREQARVAAKARAAVRAAPARRAGSRGKRARKRPIATRPSRRARPMPTHWWMPEPKATWRFGVRAMSSRSGSANGSGSRLAAPMPSVTCVRGASATPPISVAQVVIRLPSWFELSKRRNSSTALRTSSGSAMRRAFCVGPVEQAGQAVADQVGRRLVAGVEQEDAVVQQLGRAQRSRRPRLRSAGSGRRPRDRRARRGAARPGLRGRAGTRARRGCRARAARRERRLERAEDRERPVAQRRALLVRHGRAGCR